MSDRLVRYAAVLPLIEETDAGVIFGLADDLPAEFHDMKRREMRPQIRIPHLLWEANGKPDKATVWFHFGEDEELHFRGNEMPKMVFMQEEVESVR